MKYPRAPLAGAAAWLLLGVATVLGSAMPAPQNEYVETFDEAWRIINETHWDESFNGLDWTAIRDELRPRAAAAASIRELRAVITEMLSRLDRSHFALWPGESAGARRAAGDDADERAAGVGTPGFSVVLVADRFVVNNVAPESPAMLAGVRTGWIVRTVNGEEVGVADPSSAAYVDEHKMRVTAQRSMLRRLSGIPGASLAVDFLDEEDHSVSLEIDLQRQDGQLSRFGNMPPIFADVSSQILTPDVGLNIGVVAFNIWLPVLAGPLNNWVDTVRDTDGVIIDLRGNPGGIGGMVMGFGGHFVDEEVSLGTMRTRDSELQFRANPRRVDTSGNPVDPFAGPVAVLIDNTTASTSEVFAAGLQSIGRARVFGQRSMGAVLPSLVDELPNGDILQHAFADFVVTATGVRLEGRGVLPDEEIVITRRALLDGRDPIRDAAVEWIVRQR